MIPTEIILRIDVRGLSLIEVEQICRSGNILKIIQALPGRLCHTDIAGEEQKT